MRRYLSLLLFIGLGFWSCEEEVELEKTPEPCELIFSSELKDFSDSHWTLDDWVTNRFLPPTQINESMSWTNFPALINLTGNNQLSLIISGDLANELNDTLVSSDSLDVHPDWVYSGDINVLKDDYFYRLIGTNNQFLGGWRDASSDWYWYENESGEIIISTPIKDAYRQMLPSSFLDTTSPSLIIITPNNYDVYSFNNENTTFQITIYIKENIGCDDRNDELNYVSFNIESNIGHYRYTFYNSENGWEKYQSDFSIENDTLKFSIEATSLLGTNEVKLSCTTEDFAGNKGISDTITFYIE